jgi:hypothetical protein
MSDGTVFGYSSLWLRARWALGTELAVSCVRLTDWRFQDGYNEEKVITNSLL